MKKIHSCFVKIISYKTILSILVENTFSLTDKISSKIVAERIHEIGFSSTLGISRKNWID